MISQPEAPSLDLHRVRNKLLARLVALESRIATGQDGEAIWHDYVRTLDVYLCLEDRIAVQAPTAPLLTTREMAERLGITVKTLLRRKKRGHIRPAVAHGKALRWQVTDAFR